MWVNLLMFYYFSNEKVKFNLFFLKNENKDYVMKLFCCLYMFIVIFFIKCVRELIRIGNRVDLFNKFVID